MVIIIVFAEFKSVELRNLRHFAGVKQYNSYKVLH